MATSTKTLLLNKGKGALTLQTRLLSSQTLPCRSSIVSDHTGPEKYLVDSAPALAEMPEPLPPLSILPLSSIVRSLAITSISSSKLLLPPSLAIMSTLAHTNSRFLSPDHNPLLRYFLKKTFYAHFCAGENSKEVKRTVDGLRSLGFSGVILAYAKEVVMDEKESSALSPCPDTGTLEQVAACIQNEILPWKKGTLETVQMTTPGDYVALKFTGAGSQALYALSKNLPPSPALRESIDEICHLATKRGVRLLFDAEQAAVQKGIDAWTLEWMKKCNKAGRAVVYGTYQAYLKSTPALLTSHLQAAKENGFTLGVKLVRGAYLGSDPRHLIHDTKADTDAAYDGIAESLVRRSYGPYLQGSGSFPVVDIVLAGHNITSVQKVQAICKAQKERGEQPVELIYAQLQGMADEVSCELVTNGYFAEAKAKWMGMTRKDVDVPKAYKYLVWGTTGECMKYLLRRAQENKDAVSRTKSGRDAMWRELGRRVRAGVGL